MELKQKEVINLCDGKRLGKVCDLVFLYPEGRVQGIVVPGGRGFRFGRADLFIELKNVKKIGIDVVLVDIKSAPPKPKRKNKWGEEALPPPHENHDRPQNCPPVRRDYGEYDE